MVLKKRSRSDASLLDEQLPLNDIELYQQNNHSLREALEEYRKENDTLYRNNVILSRKNDCLDLLLVSVSSLWDMLNSDIDRHLSQQLSNPSFESSEINGEQGDEIKLSDDFHSGFWDKLISIKFPFQLSIPDHRQTDVNLDSLSYIYDSDDYLLGDSDYSGSDDTWSKIKDDFIQNKVEFFNKKKDELLKHIKSYRSSKYNSNALSEGNFRADRTLEPSVSDDKRLSNDEVTQLLKLGCFNYNKLLILLNEKHRSLKETANNLKIENSRLAKQNSFLKFELKSFSTDRNLSPSKNDTPDASVETPLDTTSSARENSNVKIVDNVDEVSEDLILGSLLYLKVFSHCQALDEEISRLEKENSQLRINASNIMRTLDEKYFDFKEKFEKLNASVLDQLREYEALCSQKEQDLLLLKNDYSALNKIFEEKNKENERLLTESQEKDSRIAQLTAHNASLCRKFVEGASTSNPELEDFKEQLLNISEELEVISTAFEEKKRTCDEIMRQLNDNSINKEKIISLQTSNSTIQEKLNKVVSICDAKLSNYTQHQETLENIVKDYKDSWFHSYKRSCYLEQQRDHAYSALSEVQSQYRKSCRAQKVLQNRLSLSNEQSTVLEPKDNATNLVSDVNHVFRENEILRRKMTCTVCCENFRDHCITKCGHIFCQNCLTNNIKSRNRKCPQCKINFDKNDTQRIFLD